MNWLTHIYFSDGSKENMLGSFLGDFLANSSWNTDYDEAITAGIKNHLRLDQIGTCHPVFSKSCNRISKKNTHYAMILIDVFYDHFLSRDWEIYSNTHLPEFIDSFYKVLIQFKSILPEKLLKIMPKLINENWLVSYREFQGIQEVLNRLSKRIKNPNTIDECLIELKRNYSELEKDFNDFIVEMKKIFYFIS
ncbi:MAG: acyl carrier protein phosphodiesterase [Spirochaetales bacterium]|nr:acyl carrier protein phosphodiesterase [Spirochaetales bacterium]